MSPVQMWIRVIEGGQVQRGDFVPLVQELAHEVDAEESGAAGDEYALLGRVLHGAVSGWSAHGRGLVTKEGD